MGNSPPTKFDTRLYVQQFGCGASRRVSIDEGGVYIDALLAIPRREIVGAVVLPITGSDFLRVFVVQRNRKDVAPWTFDVANRSDADVMLRELRAGFEQRAIDLRIDGGAFGEAAFFVGIAFTVGGLLAAWYAPEPFTAILAIVTFLAGAFLLAGYILGERAIVVGRDGVVVRRLRSRYYAYRDIERLQRRSGRVDLVLYGGKVVSLLVPNDKPRDTKGPNVFGADVLTTLLHLRIEEAMNAHRALDHDAEPRLRGRPRNHSYREHAAPDAPLRDVVVDSHRSDAVRLAAAVSLLEQEGSSEVGELAKSVASPQLRVALERIAAEDGEEKVATKIEKSR